MTPIEISLPLVNKFYGKKNLYCKWTVYLDKMTEDSSFILNYSDLVNFLILHFKYFIF